MSAFLEWIDTCDVESVSHFSEKLKGFADRCGLSDCSFIERDHEALVGDFVAAGIEKPAAWEIVKAASNYFKTQRAHAAEPLAVFWDAENMQVPNELSGHAVAQKIESSLQPFGKLALFNAYMSIDHNVVPAHKRSELQQMNCTLIDTPHINKKEVADKMIIVDAMHFAAGHKDTGGTIALITADTDFTYLLSKLRLYSNIRTVLITRAGGVRAVLDSRAGSLLRWETEVLGLRAQPQTAVPVPIEFKHVNTAGDNDADEEDEGYDTTTSSDICEKQKQGEESIASNLTGADGRPTGGPSPEDLISDDLELLVYAVTSTGQGSPLKSTVGNALKSLNPVQFRSKEARDDLFRRALHPTSGILVETFDEFNHSMLSLRRKQDGSKMIDAYASTPESILDGPLELPRSMCIYLRTQKVGYFTIAPSKTFYKPEANYRVLSDPDWADGKKLVVCFWEKFRADYFFSSYPQLRSSSKLYRVSDNYHMIIRSKPTPSCGKKTPMSVGGGGAAASVATTNATASATAVAIAIAAGGSAASSKARPTTPTTSPSAHNLLSVSSARDHAVSLPSFSSSKIKDETEVPPPMILETKSHTIAGVVGPGAGGDVAGGAGGAPVVKTPTETCLNSIITSRDLEEFRKIVVGLCLRNHKLQVRKIEVGQELCTLPKFLEKHMRTVLFRVAIERGYVTEVGRGSEVEIALCLPTSPLITAAPPSRAS